MKRLIIPPADRGLFHYADDVERIISICAASDYEIDAATARAAWESYSESMAAGWMGLPDEDWLVLAIVLEQTVAVENGDGVS